MRPPPDLTAAAPALARMDRGSLRLAPRSIARQLGLLPQARIQVATMALFAWFIATRVKPWLRNSVSRRSRYLV